MITAFYLYSLTHVYIILVNQVSKLIFHVPKKKKNYVTLYYINKSELDHRHWQYHTNVNWLSIKFCRNIAMQAVDTIDPQISVCSGHAIVA